MGRTRFRRGEECIETHPGRLRRVFLPTYSPWLNPIEMLWRVLKQRILKNHPYSPLRQVTRSALTVLRDLSPAETLSIIGTLNLT